MEQIIEFLYVMALIVFATPFVGFSTGVIFWCASYGWNSGRKDIHEQV